MKAFYRALRIVSAITLFFFAWTYLPVYAAVAYAADMERADRVGVNQSLLAKDTTPLKSPLTKGGSRGVDPGKNLELKHGNAVASVQKFEKALEDIREKVGKAEEKADKDEDITAEVAEVQKKRAEIESLDVELRKGFSATEKKLKAAKLPKEILNRHYTFVKNYEKNLTQLKTEIDDIEKATTRADRKAKIEKARLHLEKTKAPSRHQKLDPNNLPFRAQKAGKSREPRLDRKQFEKDFPLQKRRNVRTATSNLQNLLSADSRRWTQIFNVVAFNSALANRPVIVASNGPLTGILASDPKPKPDDLFLSVNSVPSVANTFSLNWELNTQSYQLALATDLPTADDLAETPDIQFTDAIRAKAEELGGNPVKIYEWVRNNIEYAPTYGSIQGADQCLQSKICNDMDTASLLIAFLRVSGIYSHYVYGTIEVPIDKAMNWVGGVTDPKMVGTIFATNGVPAKMLISGGTYKAVQLEHVWVSAFIDYIPSRGAVHRQGDTWIPLDPSYKQYNYTQGIDIKSAVPFDAQSFADQLVATATTNTVEGYVTNVNSALVQQTMQDYQAQVQNYIQQNHPNSTVGDVIGKKEIIKQEFGILVGTLPYKTDQVGTEFATVPSNLRATMSFSIPDITGMGTGLFYSTSLPEIAGKKITLSFSPATANDQAVIESFLPTPHVDGTPILPSEMPKTIPAYLINLVSEIRLDGEVVGRGNVNVMGAMLRFAIISNEPNIGINQIMNDILSGEYYCIGTDISRISEAKLNSVRDALVSTTVALQTKQYAGLKRDTLFGDLLYNTVLSYFSYLDRLDEIASISKGIIRMRTLSVALCSMNGTVQEAFGLPLSMSSYGLKIDADKLSQAVFAKDGSQDRIIAYMIESGNVSSMQEHAILESFYSTAEKELEGVSSVKILLHANSQSMPIYAIGPDNINAVLPRLSIDSDVVNDIKNVINAGKIVIIPCSNVDIKGWHGSGYIITDPKTGAGAYMISGGASGGMLLEAIGSIISHVLVTEAAAAELEDTYIQQAPVPIIQTPPSPEPPCLRHFHDDEFSGCVLTTISSNSFLEGVSIASGTALGAFILFKVAVGYIVSVLAILAIVTVIANIVYTCRQAAWHC